MLKKSMMYFERSDLKHTNDCFEITRVEIKNIRNKSILAVLYMIFRNL